MENWLQRGRRLGRTDQEDPDDPPCTGSSGSSVNFEPVNNETEATQESSSSNIISSPSSVLPDDSEEDAACSSGKNLNPWPYIAPLFKFHEIRGQNAYFICKSCPPTSKVNSLSASGTSNVNLRRNLTRKHSSLLTQFDN